MNSVFHPSKKNPFQVPPLPPSHYAPSPIKEILDKSVTLTPQKLKNRHEYSLPPQVYTPEQYSIHEEKSPFNKPPLPTHDDDVVLNLQQFLNDAEVETWDSAKFCEKWSSRISDAKEDTPSRKLVFDKLLTQCPLSSTFKSEALKPSAITTKEKPTRIQSSFASERNSSMDFDRTSNIQQRLDRFRYGAPKAPDKRNADKSKESFSSGMSIRNLRSLRKSQNSPPKQAKVTAHSPMKENTGRIRHAGSRKVTVTEHNKTSVQEKETVPKPPLPPPTSESPDLIDTSLSSLNSRLDRLIQQSSSVAASPLSTSKSTVDRSASSILKVSSDASVLSALSSDLGLTQKKLALSNCELPRRMLWQKDDSSPRRVKQGDGAKGNDILYQWRLKRKLEEAREHVENRRGIPYRGGQSLNSAERPFSAEASRVLQDSTSINGIGIRSNPVSTKKQNSTYFHPSRQDFPHSHYSPIAKPVNFYQAPCGCQCTHQLPHVTVAPERMPTKQDVAVGVTEMVSIKTQTGKSLIFSEDGYNNSPTSSKQDGENRIKSASANTFQHTSTPASTVSFHRVKIVEAEPENSPQPAKDFSRAQHLTPESCKTGVTTIWSSTDHKRRGGTQSPVSSLTSSHQQNASDAEPHSPTTDVVKEIVGAHLFNTTHSSSTTSAISRLKNRKKLCDEKTKPMSTDEDCLNGSYTKSDSTEMKKLQTSSNVSCNPDNRKQGYETHDVESQIRQNYTNDELDHQSGMRIAKSPSVSPVKPLSPVDEILYTEDACDTMSENSMEEDCESDFDPDEIFNKILKDAGDDQHGLSNEKILQELKRQKNHILEEFRLITEEIESCESS